MAIRVGTVFAHPDDETFGAGGTLIRAVRRRRFLRYRHRRLGKAAHPLTRILVKPIKLDRH